MKRFGWNVLFLIAFFAANTFAYGTVLVDTGSPATTQNGAISVCGGGFNGCTQSVALEFSLASAANISGVQGYVWSGVNPGVFTLALYSSINGLPATELFSSTVSVPVTTSDWYGVSGVNWKVSAGDYWASFEVRNGQSFYGALEFPAPVKLPVVVKNDYYTNWTNIGGGGGGGLIVTGSSIAPVPEPETYAMLLAGLGLIGAVVKRHKVMQA